MKSIENRIEVFRKESALGFDLGDIAVVVEYVWDAEDTTLTVYVGESISKIFYRELCQGIKDPEEIMIDREAFQAIEKAARSWKKVGGQSQKYAQLWGLLDDNFAPLFKKYGFS